MISLLFNTAYFFLLPLAVLSSVAIPKLRRGLVGRIGLEDRIRVFSSRLKGAYWFHIASAGELEQCLPIMDALRSTQSKPILLTYFSPTAARACEREAGRRHALGKNVPWDHSDFCPLDFSWAVDRFIRWIEPHAFIAINRELWPNLVLQLKMNKVPMFLFAVYLDIPSRKKLRFQRWLLKHFDAIGTLDSSTAQYLRAFTHAPVEALGDPRIKRVLDRRALAGTKAAPREQVFLCASIWEKDFRALKPTLRFALQTGWSLILVPHEPTETRISQIEKWLRTEGVPHSRWSESRNEPAVIVDTVGELAELYHFAELVFVGGSFQKRIHNVLEPASYGKPILTGPFVSNSCEAISLSKDPSGLRVTRTSRELLQAFQELAAAPDQRQAMSQRLQAFLASGTDAPMKYCSALLVSCKSV